MVVTGQLMVDSWLRLSALMTPGQLGEQVPAPAPRHPPRNGTQAWIVQQQAARPPPPPHPPPELLHTGYTHVACRTCVHFYRLKALI